VRVQDGDRMHGLPQQLSDFRRKATELEGGFRAKGAIVYQQDAGCRHGWEVWG
jgi:hypothetical protein